MITAKPVKVAADRPSTAPAKMRAKQEDSPAAPQAGSTAPRPVKRPTSGAAKKPAAGAPAPAAASKKPPAAVKKGKETKIAVEKEMSDEEVEEKAADLFPLDVLTGLCDNVWKTRLAAVEEFSQVGLCAAPTGKSRLHTAEMLSNIILNSTVPTSPT